MILDVHCHYGLTNRRATAGIERFSFEPVTHDDVPAFDACLAPRVLRRPSWRIARWIGGIDPHVHPGDELDTELERQYGRHLLGDGPIERFVLLAFDAYHDDAGGCPRFPETRDELGSDMYVSNSFVRELCRRHPGRFLFGASVHPYRPNAVAHVKEVFAAGACLIKWIPLHQNIDVADRRTLDVLRCCADLGLPLLVHYSEEFTLATQHRQYQSVTALLDVLRRLRRDSDMPTTIVAHLATPVTPFGEWNSHRALMAALLGEFADAPLYADISALTSWGKVFILRRIAAMQELHPKLLFGTDFPVPLGLLWLRRALGDEYCTIAAEPSWPQRVARICRQLGFSEIVFHRAAELLPHVDHFARSPGA